MNADLTAQLRAQLLDQRTSMLERLANLRGGVVGRAEASAEHFARSEDSDAQVNSARELEFALDEIDTAELRLIDAALRRMQAGSYGKCVDCAVTIPQARLRAAPHALRCIACQEKVE